MVPGTSERLESNSVRTIRVGRNISNVSRLSLIISSGNDRAMVPRWICVAVRGAIVSFPSGAWSIRHSSWSCHQAGLFLEPRRYHNTSGALCYVHSMILLQALPRPRSNIATVDCYVGALSAWPTVKTRHQTRKLSVLQALSLRQCCRLQRVWRWRWGPNWPTSPSDEC